MPRIYDNIDNHLVDGLNDSLKTSYKSDFCVGYFNLRGWKAVAEKISLFKGGSENQCRLLIGMQKPPIELIRDYFNKSDQPLIDKQTLIQIKKKLAEEFREQLTIGIPTSVDENALRKLSAQIKEEKVRIKLFLRHPLHAKLYLTYSEDTRVPIYAFLGSSNLTFSGIIKQGELNIDVADDDATKKLEQWFNDRWDDKWCIDISDELAAIIDNSWINHRLPFHIYIKVAYHLSREARSGIAEYKVSREFEQDLLDFQKKAVQVAAHHLNKRGGVIIGDVVGLGKTIIATALAKIFEDDYYLETLIICPKNLVNMWADYKHKYRLRADILPITEAQAKLPDLRRYRVVIIDESHNLRNRNGKRYKAIQSYIQLNDSKVILLSATPYNKTYLDLSNQLRLFIPDEQDLGISPEKYVESVGGKVQFVAKYQTPIRSLSAFEKSPFPDDWRELMRLYLVRRTRSFVKNNYANNDDITGRKYLEFRDGSRSYFPDRIAKKVEYPFDPHDPTDQYARLYDDDIVQIIDNLNLPRYGLGLEIYTEKKPKIAPTAEEEIIQSNLGRAGARLKGFARTNLFKRLESSGHSFLLSVARHILRNYIFLYALDNNLPFPIGKQDMVLLDDYLDDEDVALANETQFSIIQDEIKYYDQAANIYTLFKTEYEKHFDWIGSHLFSANLNKALRNDTKELFKVLKLASNWNPDEDRQLNALYKLIDKKHKKEKILIFTQFADTANYLCDELSKRGVKQLACVTGATDDPTWYAQRFSPVSNNKNNIIDPEDEYRILISTDVLSEGQNLQDAHIVLNYDLPWAIIRLIQRAGRVDRIGQQAEKIYCYSFLPEDGIERIIRLRSRLQHRLEQSDEVLGSPDEIFFETQKVREQLEAIYSEKSGILDEEEEGEVDLASYAYQIWKNATDAYPELNQLIPNMPNVVYATKANIQEPEKEGAIVYTKTPDDYDVLSWVDKSNNIITQSQLTILKTVECSPEEPPLERHENHHEMVESAMTYIKETDTVTGGALGRQTGVRYKIYMILTRYFEAFKNTLFVNDNLKRAIDDIYRYPLKESAKDAIARQMKSGATDDALAALVTALREEDRLSIIHDEEQEVKDHQIICSMGLKNI